MKEEKKPSSKKFINKILYSNETKCGEKWKIIEIPHSLKYIFALNNIIPRPELVETVRLPWYRCKGLYKFWNSVFKMKFK